eukprot:sb/3476829/
MRRLRSHVMESQEQLLKDITQQFESKNAGGAEAVRNLEVQVLKLESEKQDAARRVEGLKQDLQELQMAGQATKTENASLKSRVRTRVIVMTYCLRNIIFFPCLGQCPKGIDPG